MGIDAQIYVRIRGKENWLRDEDELAVAVQLAQAIGYGHFFISNPGYSEKEDKRHHALSIMRPHNGEWGKKYKDKVVIFQDGPEIIAAPDEQFLEVHIWSRYYGPGYARGDWPTIRSICEWLEWKFPKGEVWYGGDSSGVVAQPFGKEMRQEYNDLYLSSGRITYTHGWNLTGGRHECPRCMIQMINSGGGQGVSFLYCDGCGAKLRKHATGKLEWLGVHDDFFGTKK